MVDLIWIAVAGITVGVLVGILGGRLTARYHAKKLEQEIDAMVAAIMEESKNLIPVRLEEHQGIFYIYDVRDEMFVAQGNNITELREHLESRMRDAHVFVVKGDPEAITRLRATA